MPKGDAGLLEYMYKNGHTTPFEMCELIIDVKVPMDTWRQWIRHRTASVNEYSTRYSPAIDEAAVTAPDKWRTQGVTNRQGSGGFVAEFPDLPKYEAIKERGVSPGKYLSLIEEEHLELAREVYEERLAFGVAKEQARKDLPLSTYTLARWKCDLHNLLHFLGKRMHPHAQQEIREYATAIGEQLVAQIWPRSYALFKEHTLGAEKLSATEVKALRALSSRVLIIDPEADDERALIARFRK
jgi:thymidylate synthase (FAD)